MGRVGSEERKEGMEGDGVEGAYTAVEHLCVVGVLRCVTLCGAVRAWGAVKSIWCSGSLECYGTSKVLWELRVMWDLKML